MKQKRHTLQSKLNILHSVKYSLATGVYRTMMLHTYAAQCHSDTTTQHFVLLRNKNALACRTPKGYESVVPTGTARRRRGD